MHELFGGLRGRQVGFQHIAAIEFGGFGLRVLLDRQRHGTLHDGQFDPVSDAQLFGPSHKLLQAPWALARGWSVRYWFCLATWAWSVASFACRVSLISWARMGLRRST